MKAKFGIRFAVINHILILFVLVLTFGFGAIFMFFWFFTLDITASGQGVVNCRTWIDIKPEIRGIVREVAVKEGQWVRKGEILFSLEDRERELEVKETGLRIAELEISITKIENSLFLTEEKISAEINEARALLKVAEANYRVACKGPKPEEIRLAESKILRAKKEFEKSKKDYERAESLYEYQLIPRVEYKKVTHMMNLMEMDLRLAQEEMTLLKNRFDADQIAAVKAEVDCKQAILKRATARKIELNIMRRDLESTVKQKAKEEQKLTVLKQHLYLTCIYSPIDGHVLTHDIEHLAGKAVVEGEVVLRIGDIRDYIIDCRVSEKDFPLVEVGQIAKIQINPFPEGEYKLFSAEVIHVGADVYGHGLPNDLGLMEKMSGFSNPSKSSQEGFFPVILKLEKPYDIHIFGDVYHVRPGFSAEVEIITQQERIVTYLLRRILRIKGKVTTNNIHL